jgi:hypothetical protein
MSDYDDPAVEEAWCQDRRAEVSKHLQREGVDHGRIGEWPAWHIAPYVSVWAIESITRPGWVGWWAISGDLPTDYVSAKEIKQPREAVLAIANRWLEVSSCLARGVPHPELKIGTSTEWPSSAPLLESRASTLLEWANDQSLWEEEAI